MLDLTKEEHQDVVLMTGSKKDWILYLGLEDEEGRALWAKLGLIPPTQYVRNSQMIDLIELVVEEGSVRKAAKQLGVSEAFLRKHLTRRGRKGTSDLTAIHAVKQYKSIRLATRILNKRIQCKKLSEAEVRRLIREGGEDPAALVDYAFSNHEAGKGRRAELDWSGIRVESQILKDMNEEMGSQADFDFLDSVFGRVNVKSSSQHRMKAKSRGQQRYWKFSAHGKDNADNLICVCYDEGGEFLAWTWRKPDEVGDNSFQITETELKEDERTEWLKTID